MTSALVVLLEATLFLALALDLVLDFAILPLWSRFLFVVLAAAGFALLRRAPRERVIERLRAPICLLAGAVVVLSSLGAAEAIVARRIAALWDGGSRGRLEERARTLQADFSWFLDEILRPLVEAGPEGREPAGAFQALTGALERSGLPHERLGFSIYREDGSLLAWCGNTEAVSREALASAGSRPAYWIGLDETARRLYAVMIGPRGQRWVGEFLLKPPGPFGRGDDLGARLEFLPHWERAGPAHIHLREDREGVDDVSRFFMRQADRYWGRSGREGVTTLSFPLRAPDGATLAVVTLKDRRADREAAALRRRFRLAGALLASCVPLLAWLLLARGGRMDPALRLGVGTAALWSARFMLLWVATAADLPRLAVYDIGLYASPALLGLLRSPADLLLTAITCLAQAWLLSRYLRSVPAPTNALARARARLGADTVLLVILAAGALGLHAALDRLALNSRLDVSRVELDADAGPRLALQASIFLVVVSLALGAEAIFDLGLRCRDEGWGRRLRERLQEGSLRRLPLALRVAGGALLLTLLYVPFLVHAYDRLRRTFLEEDLLPRVVYQKERRAQVLRDSAAMAGDEEFATLAAFAAEEARASGSVAYRLWSETPMAEVDLASSLRLFDASGRLLDRFAVNFAPGLEVPFGTAAAAAGADPQEVPPRLRAIVKKTVLFTSRTIRAPRRPPLLVVMSVIDDYDNLPLVGAGTGYEQMFRARTVPRTNPEILRFDPMVAVFGPHLERLYESGGEIPSPGPREARALDRRGVAWAAQDAGEGPVRVLYARGSGVTFALAQAREGPTAILASTLRHFLLNGILATLLVALARAVQRTRPSPAPGGRFYRRLTVVFLLTALVPLLALAYFVTRFSAREFARDLTTSGLSALQVARRVAEDYLTVSSPEEAPSLDDDVVFWMSRVVRQDLNIYRGADLLATSTRELYASGLLNTRLDGSVYLGLYLQGEPFRQGSEHAGGLEYPTLSAPMRVDREGTMGVISIPLGGQRRATVRKVQEVEDAVLISTCLTVLLLAGVGYLVARRVSGPISMLARAARRVAEGDLDVRVGAAAGDEIGVLVDAFNRMAGALREQREDLRRRRDYIEKILRSATTGVVSIDGSGSIITINPAAQQLLGGPSVSFEAGANLAERLAGDPTVGPLRTALLLALEGRAEREAELVLAKGGAERRLRAVFIPFAPEEGAPPGMIVLLEDVTEIVRSGRLAAWAEMARRIAHEIKNPLTPIQLSIEHVRRVRGARDDRFDAVLTECLDNIQRQVRELRQIASEFSAYARLPGLRPEATDVAAILEDALGPYLAAPPPGVALRRDLPEGLPQVLADRAVIARALVNLIENALQAMPDGGTLTVGAALDGPPRSGARVRVEVRDTGLGIDPAIMPRLFDPYFSTKSGGTGLGLAIVRRAVEDHGGTIDVQSRPGEGTIVALTLPIAVPASGGAPLT